MEAIMRKHSLIIALAFASTSAFAGFWGEGNQDVHGYILNDEPMSYVGTGLEDARPVISIYDGLAGPDALDGFRGGGMTRTFSVNTDEDGSILVETGVRH
jgi:hypothetical protein